MAGYSSRTSARCSIVTQVGGSCAAAPTVSPARNPASRSRPTLARLQAATRPRMWPRRPATPMAELFRAIARETTLEDGSGGFTDADGNPIEQGDGGADETSPMALLSGLGDTIGGGLKYLQSKFSLGQSSSGIPSDPSFLGNVQRLLGGEGAASKEDYAAVTKAVDPDGKLTEGLRNAAGLNAVYKYYLAKGDPDTASKTAAALLMHMRSLAAEYGDRAVGYLQKGKTQDAINELTKGYEQVPDGNTVEGKANNDGTVNVTQKDAQGQPVAHFRATPQQLFAAATGLSNGTEYWKTLIQAAGKKDPGAEKEEEQPSAAFQQWQQGNAPQGAQPTARPTAQPVPLSPTQSAQNAPQSVPQTAPQSALPLSQGDEDDTPSAPQTQAQAQPQTRAAPSAPQSALPVTPQGNALPPLQLPPEPQLPDNIRQMKPKEQQQVYANWRAEHQMWQQEVSRRTADRAATMRRQAADDAAHRRTGTRREPAPAGTTGARAAHGATPADEAPRHRHQRPRASFQNRCGHRQSNGGLGCSKQSEGDERAARLRRGRDALHHLGEGSAAQAVLALVKPTQIDANGG